MPEATEWKAVWEKREKGIQPESKLSGWKFVQLDDDGDSVIGAFL